MPSQKYQRRETSGDVPYEHSGHKARQYTKGLSLAEYCVLISLASFADRDGMCWPSMETLADISNIDKRTAVRAIQRLTTRFSLTEPRALVSIVKNIKVKVRTSTYQLNLELLKELQGKRLEGDTTPPMKRKYGETTPPLGCNTAPPSDIASGDTTPPEQGGANSDFEPSKRTVSVNLSASAYAKERASYLIGIINTDFKELGIQIALRHPRSRLLSWTRHNVSVDDLTAIRDAMMHEAQEQGTTMAEVGRMMLLTLDAWDEVPRDKWQFAAAIPRFYKQGDYRVPPNELPGIAPRDEEIDGGIRKAPHAGDGEALHSDDVGGNHLGVQPSRGGVQVLPTPYPPGVQWPRRNG